MITRAYQNAEGERQEVTLAPEAWEALTEQDLQNLLGFGKKHEPANDPEPEAEKFEPVPVKAPAKKKRR